MDNNSEKLRAQAKEELRQGKIIDTSLYETDMKVLVEELSIYQIELEHQNQELMLSQEHLQQSNNRYLDLFDNAPVGYLIVDSTGIIKDINQTACVLLENSKTQFIDTKISKLIHPDYQDIYFLYFRTLIHQKHNQPCDIKLRKANNSFFYGRIQGVCQTSEIDSDPEFRLAISDISSQKEMEIKLLAAKELTEQSEKQHRTILQTAMDGYWLVDLDGKFLEVNDAYCSMSGYTKTELLNMHISDFEVIENIEKTEYHIKKVIVNGSDRFESKHRRKDGSVYYVEISTVYQNEYKNAFVVFIRDISEQKLAENTLLEAEWKFKALFDLGPIGVAYHRMIYDEAGKPIDYYFIDANDSYNELTGVNPKGMSVREAFPGIENDPFDWIGKFGHVAKTGETIRFEQFLESNQRWYDVVGYQYKPDHFVAAFSEITKRKEAEIALKESELRFKVLFDDAPDAMFLADPASGRIVDANNAAALLFKKQNQELVGLFQYELHPPQNTDISKSTFKTQFEEKKESRKNIFVENSILCSDGTEIPVEIVGQAIQIGEKALMFGIFRDISKRKEVEKKLTESETKFRNFFENSVVGKSITSLNGELSANKAFCDIVGYSEEELNRLNWKEITHPDDVEMNIKILKSIIDGEKNEDHWEKRYIHKNGTIVWIEIATTLQRDNEGKPAYFISEMIDITERKQADEALKQSEEKFAVAFKTSPYAITITRPEDGKFIEVNDAFYSMTGYSPEEALNSTSIGMDLWVDAEDRNNVLKVLRTGKTINGLEFHFKKKNGEIITGLFSAHLIDIKNKTYILSNINDITERKIIENELNKHKEQFEDLYENAPIGYHEIDNEGRFVRINKTELDMLGYNSDEVLGKHIWEFINDQTLSKSATKSKLSGHEISTLPYERKFIHKNGNLIPILLKDKVIKDASGLIIGNRSTIQDITERKKAEEALKANNLRLELAMQASKMAWWEMEMPSGNVVFNKRKAEMLGYSPENFKHYSDFMSLVHPEDAEKVMDAMRNHMYGKAKTYETEYRIVTNSGVYKWFYDIGSVVERDATGKPLKISGLVLDITERKHAEETLRKSEERYSSLLQYLETGIVVHAPDSSIIMSNPRASELLGLTFEQMQGKVAMDTDWNFVSIDNIKLLVENYPVQQIINTKQAIKDQILGIQKTANHTIIWVNINGFPVLDTNGEITEIVISFNDITERKNAEEALRESEELLSLYIKNSPIYSFIKKVSENESKVLYASENFIDMIGISGHEMIGKTMYELFPPEFAKKITADDWDVHKTSEVLKLDETLNGKDYITIKFPITQGNRNLLAGFTIDISERKHAEELFKDIVDKNPMSIQIVDKEGYTLQTNPAFSKLFGSIPPSYYSIFDDLISKGPEFETLIHRTISGEVVHLPDIYYNVHDILPETPNNPHWIRALIFPLKDSTGKPERFVVMHEDITERKHAEDALRESEEKFKKAFIVSPDSININRLDDGMYVSINKGFTRIMGYTEDEIIGKTSKEMNIWVDFNDRIKLIEGLKQYGFVENLVAEFKNKNGKSVTGMMSAIVIELNGEKNILSITRDVTELKKAEKALRESEEKLSTLFNSMTEMVVMHELVFDNNGDAIDYRILDCNKTFTSITGIEKENAVGRLATEVYGIETAPYLQEYANVALNGTSQEFNTYYLPLEKYFLISVVSSEKNKFSTISTDITSNEQIHEIIKEKNKEMENYIYVASHDLRSPLVNIQGFSKRLQKQTAELTKLMAEMNANAELAAEYKRLTTDDIPKSLSFILNNVSKMDTLINGLLQVSRTGRVVMSPTILEMNKLFKSILTIFDYQLKEMEANVILHELDTCYGDTNQLNQLFSNIIGNALKYSDKNRKLTLEISSHTKYNKVIYSIKDNGIGINNRHLQKIWDVFYRVDASAPEAGEGLGLSLAKRIVDKHKGKIWAESVEGEGSTFFVELHKNKFEE